MGKIIHFYKIADIVIRIELPFSYFEMEEYQAYRIQEGVPDVSVVFKEGKYRIPMAGRSILLEHQRITESENGYYVELLTGGGEKSFGCLMQEKGEKRNFVCFLKQGAEKYLPHSTQVFRSLSLDHLLNEYGACILHASYIRWKGRAVLFSAPSGTGKSTQAKLWSEYEEAEIVNGDRAAIRKQGGIWKAYGLPYAGSSRIFKNITTEIGWIIILRQGKENSLEPLNKPEAWKYLYSECIVHLWDRDYMERLTNMLTEIVREIPIYRCCCRADVSAVESLREELEIV